MNEMLAAYYNLDVDKYNDPNVKVELDSVESFNDYKYNLKEDPVLKFINLCIPETEENKDEYESIVTYLSKLFYSVKGTRYVIDYIKEYLTPDKGILEINDVTLKNNSVIISIGDVDDKDVTEIRSMFKEFIDALLYNRTGSGDDITIDGEIILNITSEITCYTSIYNITYKEFSVYDYEARL